MGLAPDIPFATRLELARYLLNRTLDTGVAMAWVGVRSNHKHCRDRYIRLEDRSWFHMPTSAGIPQTLPEFRGLLFWFNVGNDHPGCQSDGLSVLDAQCPNMAKLHG